MEKKRLDISIGQHVSQQIRLQVTINKIKKRAWDVVILQEQSQRPAFDEDQVCKDTVPALDMLVKLIKESSPNAIIQVNQAI